MSDSDSDIVYIVVIFSIAFLSWQINRLVIQVYVLKDFIIESSKRTEEARKILIDLLRKKEGGE
jgi:hypothetical protein